jgi:hypothetical protein
MGRPHKWRKEGHCHFFPINLLQLLTAHKADMSVTCNSSFTTHHHKLWAQIKVTHDKKHFLPDPSGRLPCNALFCRGRLTEEGAVLGGQYLDLVIPSNPGTRVWITWISALPSPENLRNNPGLFCSEKESQLAEAGNVDFGALLAVTALCLQGLLRPTTHELLPLIVGRSVHAQLYNLAGHVATSWSWAA